MKNRRRWLVLALLVSAVMLVGLFAPSTLAYVMARSNTLRNGFTVPYIPPEATRVPVRVHKTVTTLGDTTIGPEGFRFTLHNKTTGETLSLTTGADGFAAVELPFTSADVGKAYTYVLSEVDGGDDHVTYSNAVYTIRIALSVDADNRVTAALTMNDLPVRQIVAEFENLYNPIVLPDTGDHSHPLLYAAMLLLSGAGVVLLLLKRSRQAMP